MKSELLEIELRKARVDCYNYYEMVNEKVWQDKSLHMTKSDVVNKFKEAKKKFAKIEKELNKLEASK